jgi:hypothetical protein
MPRVSHDQKQFYRARIRSLITQNPQITQRELKERLEMEGLNLDRKYLGTLINGLHRERAKRADIMTLNQALAWFQDAMIEIAKPGWEIMNNPMAKDVNKTLAMRAVTEAYNLMFEKLFDAGVFERKLGTLDATIRNTPLPEERKQAIRVAFENWGLLEAPKEDVQRDNTAQSG